MFYAAPMGKAPGGLADDASFHEALRTRRVRALHSREADLAEVFASVTGRELS